MIRTKLAAHEGERAQFTGTFSRYGLRRGYRGKGARHTALIGDICDEHGDLIADHIWVDSNKWLNLLNLKKGDMIGFSGRVVLYHKNIHTNSFGTYDGTDCVTVDYGLSHLADVSVLTRAMQGFVVQQGASSAVS